MALPPARTNEGKTPKQASERYEAAGSMKQQHAPRNQPKIANEQVDPKEGEQVEKKQSGREISRER